MPGTMSHHRVFRDIAPCVAEEEGFVYDFIGTKIRRKFWDRIPRGDSEVPDAFPAYPGALPPFNQEYFEWIDLLEAARGARGRFVMIELGAGYGRWLVRGAKAIQRINPIPYSLVGVEAEPTHFKWMETHFRDNDLDPSTHRLVQAAINGTGRDVLFHKGRPGTWYGQAIDVNMLPGEGRMRDRVDLRLRATLRGRRVVRMRALTLSAILKPLPEVDLIDLDVQGTELEILSSSSSQLSDRVLRLHIGTHSAEIEAGLRDLLPSIGFRCLADFPAQQENDTPFGKIRFGDGIQSWINDGLLPRFRQG